MKNSIRPFVVLTLPLAATCAHVSDGVPSYNCESQQIRSGDEIVGTMKVSSTVHGDFGTFESCDEKFSVGYGEFILSPQFDAFRSSLARQAQGENLELSVTGLIRFDLRENPKYPGSARFLSIDNWDTAGSNQN